MEMVDIIKTCIRFDILTAELESLESHIQNWVVSYERCVASSTIHVTDASSVTTTSTGMLGCTPAH